MIIDRHLLIPMRDGVNLSAKIWRPESSDAVHVPAILEYLPYRKSDGTAVRDDTMHPWFAAQGYACLRVDRRGCGDSEGIFDDEYSEEELRDGEDVIAWIAAQPWCTGKIGMQGISWGGFNGVQLAARAPEALKAVISIGTTVDRYHDDIHYKGGVQLGENVGWAATATSWFSMPPDPDLVGDAWKDLWLQRLKNMPFMAKTWTETTDRTAYWKHGSINETYETLKTPVLVMGGLYDGYRNAMAAMVENLPGPTQAIVGPWNHKYPHISTIDPKIDYHNIALRWWDRWLKGDESSAETTDEMQVYVMDSTRPDQSLTERGGTWVGIEKWPGPDVSEKRLNFNADGLGEPGPFTAKVKSNLTCGRACGEFFPFGFGEGELPGDQMLDDATSTCFTSDPLEEDTVILGAPKLNLSLSCDQTFGQVVARLCDVRPDGTSNLISLGLLNLRHRFGFHQKTDLQPGEVFTVELNFDQSAYRVPAGHKLRVSLSTSYWPYCWPERDVFELSVEAGELTLPTIAPAAMQTITQEPPIDFPNREMEIIRAGDAKRSWSEDGGRVALDIKGDHGRQKDVETGLITESSVTETWAINKDDPSSASVEITWDRKLERGHWKTRTRICSKMRGSKDAFLIEQTIETWEDEDSVFSQNLSTEVAR